MGPLTSKNAAKDAHDKPRFQWSERKPDMEDTVITPWNWESVIDKNKSAENFIVRMTGDCTYLAGEKVLPKQSLLYEEFCVLNELNGVRWSEDGDAWQRLDAAQRAGIVYELFHTNRHVTYKMIADWLVREGDAVHPVVKGGQGESGLESKMGSYIFFAKDIFGVGELDVSDYPAIENIILWNTLFEDRSILKEKLQNEFGSAGNGMLSSEQIKKICRKRLTGWGRLSKKFLCDIKVDTQAARRVSMIDVLREGNPNADRRQGETMVMIEALRDDTLDFQKKIDEHNRSYYVKNGKEMGVNELPGSPALRRSLSQAMHIVDEIVKIAGHAPANIFIEVTREEDVNKKGKRTKKRWDSIEEALKRFKEEGGNLEVMGDFKELKATNVDLDERLTLYLMQNGKCLYSGKAINLEKLMAGSGDYEVDHIIPRAYIKDDSLDNKALVCREEKFGNGRFWRKDHCVSVVGPNEETTAERIGEREARDIALDRPNVKECEDPFKKQGVAPFRSCRQYQGRLVRLARDKGGRALNEAKGGALRHRPTTLGLTSREQTTLLKGGHDLLFPQMPTRVFAITFKVVESPTLVVEMRLAICERHRNVMDAGQTVASRQRVLARLLMAHEMWFDVEKNVEVEGCRFPSYAEYHSHGEQYALVKRACSTRKPYGDMRSS